MKATYVCLFGFINDVKYKDSYKEVASILSKKWGNKGKLKIMPNRGVAGDIIEGGQLIWSHANNTNKEIYLFKYINQFALVGFCPIEGKIEKDNMYFLFETYSKEYKIPFVKRFYEFHLIIIEDNETESWIDSRCRITTKNDNEISVANYGEKFVLITSLLDNESSFTEWAFCNAHLVRLIMFHCTILRCYGELQQISRLIITIDKNMQNGLFDTVCERRLQYIENAIYNFNEEIKISVDSSKSSLFVKTISERHNKYLKNSTSIVEQITGKKERPMPSDEKVKIFISHSTEDKEKVEHLVDYIYHSLDLKKMDIMCTSVDGCNSLELGKSVPSQLKTAMLDSTVTIALITKNSITAQWVNFELGAAWILSQLTIPILAPDIEPNDLIGGLSNNQNVLIKNANVRVKMKQMIRLIANALQIRRKDDASSEDSAEASLTKLIDSFKEKDTNNNSITDGGTF
ncbi:MAG: toll/interleukin-1 receptor domain-containing protein [Candidatus Magnetobacterium sp. LHC-1]